MTSAKKKKKKKKKIHPTPRCRRMIKKVEKKEERMEIYQAGVEVGHVRGKVLGFFPNPPRDTRAL